MAAGRDLSCDEDGSAHEDIILTILHPGTNPSPSAPLPSEQVAVHIRDVENESEKRINSESAATEAGSRITDNEATDDPLNSTEDFTSLTLFLAMLSLCLVIFLVALDKTIITTAIPRITDDFKSVDQSAWYGSAYLLTASCFQLVYGRLYTVFCIKRTYLSAVLIFELGSLICTVAPNSIVLILGRAIGGIGGSGITNGSLVILSNIAPLKKRPVLTGTIMATSGTAVVLGPILGGVLTDRLSWRYCFGVNIPIGVVAIAISSVLIKSSQLKSSASYAGMPLQQRLAEIDFLGLTILLPGIVCLLLALEWGGSSYPWKNARIIALLAIAGLLVTAFIFAQSRSGSHATIPAHIIKKRSISLGCAVSSLLSGSYMLMAYYLPYYFQVIQNLTVENSGYSLLPLALLVVAGSLLGGIMTTKLGYYTPWSILGTVIATTAIGLLTTIRISTPAVKYLSFQGLAGIGLGLSSEVPIMAAQSVCVLKDTSTAISLVLFAQSIGGTIFLVVGQNVFNQILLSGTRNISPTLSESILGLGATEVRDAVDAGLLPRVLQVYNEAIVGALYVSIGTSALAFLASTGLEWKNVKIKKEASAS